MITHMTTTSSVGTPVTRRPGRPLLWLGMAVGLLGPVLYLGLMAAKVLATPWYLPVLGCLGVLLILASLVKKFTIVRLLALGLFGFVAYAEVHLLSMSKLPVYEGPVATGQAFPAFATTLADGTPFTQDDLKGDQNTVLVFFRGRW